MRRERIFRFKQFSVCHEKSAMKVGADGVLLGAWVDVSHAASIVDVGAGCGLIALMCAQRAPQASVLAIDIDRPSVEEMTENFANSPWSDRLIARHCDFRDFSGSFDHIVSNPPFFDSGIDPISGRELARHASGLSPLSLISHGDGLLKPGGRISMVCPYDWLPRLRNAAIASGMHISRITLTRRTVGSPCKRILVEFAKGVGNDAMAEILTLENDDRTPTPAYLRLGSPYYLKF